MGMMDGLFKAMGIEPAVIQAQVQEWGNAMAAALKNIDERLKAIEDKLGIARPEISHLEAPKDDDPDRAN